MVRSPKLLTIVVIALFLGGCLTVDLPVTEIRREAEAQTLAWPGLVRQALARNPDLQEARYLVTSSARSRDIAFGDYLPSVDGGLQKSVGRTTGGGPTSDSLGLDISARQSLFNGF